MPEPFNLDTLMQSFHPILDRLPDHRTGQNVTYTSKDAALSAFAVFFMHSPSFLAQQQTLQRRPGRNTAQSLFGVTQIPSDNQIRNLLDPLPPELLFPLFGRGWQILEAAGALTPFEVFVHQRWIAWEGTPYFSSQKIQCAACSHRTAANGVTTYSHTVITPVVVAPRQPHALVLPPEFITPQAGHDKQDGAQAAANRWLTQYAPALIPNPITLWGDDRDCKQPFCELLLAQHFNFILVCKPDSPPTVYDWVDRLAAAGGVTRVTQRQWNGRFGELWTYRYVNDIPLRAGEGALRLNWCELTITPELEGTSLYHKAFVTRHLISEATVAPIVAAGRTRGNIENEGNHTLKTKGYHFEHNFGHGQQHLAAFLLTLILIAFLVHTVLDLLHLKYQQLRRALAARHTFFDDLRALTRYLVVTSWEQLLDFMIRELELGPPPG